MQINSHKINNVETNLAVKTQSGLQGCEYWQFSKTNWTAKPSNRNQGQKISLQAVKKQKTLKKSNLMKIIMNSKNEVFCFSWCFSLVMVHMEVLDCPYKYGRYFLNVSFIYLGKKS